MSVASFCSRSCREGKLAVMVATVRIVLGLVAFMGASLVACQPPQPVVVTPRAGAFRGGDQLRISGRTFAGRGPLAVYICQRSAKAIVIESDQLIRVRTPRADVAGSCDLTLRFGNDEETIVKDAFAYREPVGELPIDAFDRLSAPLVSP